jgi:hypothetical protein
MNDIDNQQLTHPIPPEGVPGGHAVIGILRMLADIAGLPFPAEHKVTLTAWDDEPGAVDRMWRTHEATGGQTRELDTAVCLEVQLHPKIEYVLYARRESGS